MTREKRISLSMSMRSSSSIGSHELDVCSLTSSSTIVVSSSHEKSCVKQQGRSHLQEEQSESHPETRTAADRSSPALGHCGSRVIKS
jgi:hypothetical protein